MVEDLVDQVNGNRIPGGFQEDMPDAEDVDDGRQVRLDFFQMSIGSSRRSLAINKWLTSHVRTFPSRTVYGGSGRASAGCGAGCSRDDRTIANERI